MVLQDAETLSGATAGRAYRALERMIATLELPPSSTTTEGALIEKLDLGRTPVREAIQRLAWEGFIIVRPRSGLQVAALNVADWPLVIDARTGIEQVLARGAANNITEKIAVRLREASQDMENATSSQDVLAFMAADKMFDELIAHASGNIFAVRVAGPLQTHSRRFWYRYQSENGLPQVAGQHIRLIEAILKRDADKASAEMSDLLNFQRELATKAATEKL